MKFEDITVNNLAIIPEAELVSMHGKLHACWSQCESGADYDKDVLLSYHKIMFDEFVQRDLRHKLCDILDEETTKLEKWCISAAFTDDSILEESALVGKALSSEVVGAGQDWSTTEFINEKQSMFGIILDTPAANDIIEGKDDTIIVKPIYNETLTGKRILLIEHGYALGEVTITNAEKKDNGWHLQIKLEEIYDEPVEAEYYAKHFAIVSKQQDSLDIYVLSFPQNKDVLWQLQKDLDLPINEQSNEHSLHITLGVFENFLVDKLHNLNTAIKTIDKPFVFKGKSYEIFGKDEDVLVLHGSIPNNILKDVMVIREAFGSNDDCDFNPHITLAYDYKSEPPELAQSVSVIMDTPMITLDTGNLLKVHKPKKYKCKFCDSVATKGIMWADSKAIVPVCDKHQNAVEGTIDRIRDLSKMFKQQPKVAIIDIDGTCVDAKDRLDRWLDRCTENGVTDWAKAFDNDEVIKDPVIEGASDAAKAITNLGISVMYLTGRSEIARTGTEESLSQYHFPEGDLMMRSDKDSRDDEIIKTEFLVDLQKDFDIVGAADDDWNQKLSVMYDSLNITNFRTIKELAKYLQNNNG